MSHLSQFNAFFPLITKSLHTNKNYSHFIIFLSPFSLKQTNLPPRIFYTASAGKLMEKRRARIEEMRDHFSNDYSSGKMHQSWCFDEECRRIRMSRIESSPFSDALESLNSHIRRETVNSAAERSSSRVRISFSVGEIAKKLKKSRSIFGDDCVHRGVDATNPSTSSTNNVRTKEKQRAGLKLETARWESDTTRRKKIDLSEKDGVDAVLAANRLVCNRLVMGGSATRLETIISSIEQDCWPRRDSQCCSASRRISPLRMNREAASSGYDGTEILITGSDSSSILSSDEEAQGKMSTFLTRNTNKCSVDDVKIAETNNVVHYKAPNDEHSTSDSVSDNDFPSTPPSIDRFNVPESSKHQEEHESPVSVLDQFFEQDHIHNSSVIIFQNNRGPLKPRRLFFEECSSDSTPHQDEQDYNISQYIHLVFETSSLNWDQIATIRPLSEEMLNSSLYDEVEHLFSDSHFDTRLLFDRMNEVLLQIQRPHLVSATEKRRINRRSSLEEAVVDEIQRESEFYQTKERTLDQIVAKDVGDCRLWFDLMLENEHDIMIHISQQILEESIVDVMFDILC